MNAYTKLKKFFKNDRGIYVTRGELAKDFKIPWSTVNRNIGKLCNEGFITPERIAGSASVFYRAT